MDEATGGRGDAYRQWLAGRTVSVVGLARSGVAAARLIRRLGGRVLASDSGTPDALSAEARALGHEEGCALWAGGHPPAAFAGADLVVVSPGVPLDLSVLAGLRAGGVPVIGELELAWRVMDADVIAITGTNGKTTTTALLRHLLNARGTAGSIGTIGAVDGAGESVASTAGSLTTPGPIDLQATLAALAGRGVADVAMEASSHSLDQGRLDGLTLAAGVFTNVSRDHLDYHGTMEAYVAAKLKLSTLLGTIGIEVVNVDDDAWAALPSRGRRVTFGRHPTADVRATEVTLDAGGSRFMLTSRFGAAPVMLPLLGDFNVSNALAASACALALGLPLAQVVARLAQSPQVPGRMEKLSDRPCVVLRDYAHTPDALERALATLRPLTRGRLVVLFGCGGDRDRGKRPIMGRIAIAGADLAVVTSDNPRTEDPDAIIDEVERGMGGAAHLRITERLAAIRRVLDDARPDDTILLAGKGHETYQVVGTERLPFDEREIVQKYVNGE
jgi:UDP-N-acetylmuramoyl-L-alanyl-D-glutamate--2,6-diaminopimelate ligase